MTEYAPEQQVVVIGRKNVETSVLISYIHQQTRYACTLLAPACGSPAGSHDSAATVFIIDVAEAAKRELVDIVERLGAAAASRYISFMNVQDDDGAEELAGWPHVRGLFFRDATPDQLLKGIHAIFSGEYWFPRKLLSHFLAREQARRHHCQEGPAILTRKELEVLRLLANGCQNTAIAEQLHISPHTVKTHIYHLFRKLSVTNRIQAVNWARQHVDDTVN